MAKVAMAAVLVGCFFFFAGTVGGARAPAMFIFGDSLSDNGNNNYIATAARSNYVPYGIDIGGPSGRFCNGYTVLDFAARRIGLTAPMPYLSLATATPELLRGANYASAAAGILNDSGRHFGSRVTFDGQISLFEKTVTTQLPALIPDAAARTNYVQSSLFIINIGSNDYINNYLLPALYTTAATYNGEQFADLLISTLRSQLQRLYSLGARKMIVANMGPLGCTPNQLASGGNGGCVDRTNALARAFNVRLEPMMARLTATLPGAVLVVQDIYGRFADIIRSPARYGFAVANTACCGVGSYGGGITCMPLETPCARRDRFVFWDAFHPTQAASAILAERCYGESATDCRPYSGAQLAAM